LPYRNLRTGNVFLFLFFIGLSRNITSILIEHMHIILIFIWAAMDISSDITELGRTPVAVICAGVKSILDIPRTLEYLV